MQAIVKNKEICCIGKVSSVGENNMDYRGNEIRKEKSVDEERKEEGQGRNLGFALGD